jgi:hypothetical protein
MKGHDATEVFHRVNEVDPFFDHDDVDWIEVPLATEAACQVGFRISGRVEVRAYRTEEAEVALPNFTWDPQDIANEPVDGDVIAELVEMVGIITSTHRFTFFVTEWFKVDAVRS